MIRNSLPAAVCCAVLFAAFAATSAQAQNVTEASPPLGGSADQATVSHRDSPSTWKGAFVDSFRLLMLEHSGRIAFQSKTRRELVGPFFSDYARSVKWPHTWGDGDGWFVNYVGHPLHGAAAGRTWLNNDPTARTLELSRSKKLLDLAR